MIFNPISWFLYDPFGDDEHPPGDTSKVGSILIFLGFWVDFDRGKRQL